jgi:hypothetical protein
MSNPFLDILQKQPPPTDARQPALNVLQELCQAVEAYAQGGLKCAVVLGYPTSYGQEYRVVIRSTRTGQEHTLFRAYIPLTGRDMKLELYDFSMVDCPDEDALRENLKLFLAREETRDTIRTYAR